MENIYIPRRLDGGNGEIRYTKVMTRFAAIQVERLTRLTGSRHNYLGIRFIRKCSTCATPR